MSIKPKINRDLISVKVHLWFKFGNLILDRWWMMAWRNWKYGNFSLLSQIWPWSSRSINPQNNRDLNQGVLLFWSKFGDSSLNGRQVIARTSKWLPHTQTHRHTDRQTEATTIPEGQNWPRVKTIGQMAKSLSDGSFWKSHALTKSPGVLYGMNHQLFLPNIWHLNELTSYISKLLQTLTILSAFLCKGLVLLCCHKWTCIYMIKGMILLMAICYHLFCVMYYV